MNIYAVLLIASVFLQGVIGYEIGDMVECGLGGFTTRGQALTDAAIIFVCIVIRFVLDRIMIRNKKNSGFSPMVLDFVSYFFCMVVLAITLEMYAASNFSITLSVLVMVAVLVVLYEKDVYLLGGVDGEEEEEDPYALDEDEEDSAESNSEDEVEEKVSDSETKSEVDEIIDKYTSSSDDVDEESDEKVEDVSETAFNDTEKEEQKNDSEEEDQENDSEEEENVYTEWDVRIYIVEVVRALAYLSAIFVGILALGDIQAEKYGVAYYLILILVAVLAFILRAVTRGLDALIKEPDSKVKFIGFSATVVLFTILICFKSLFAGFVFLLGSYLIKIIIPMLYEYYGTGGTKVVKQNTETMCRLISRIFALALILIAIWQLSYGAIWETDSLMIIAIALGSQELLIKQNISN